MLYRFFDKKAVLGASVNRQLAEELHKPAIKNCKKKENLCQILADEEKFWFLNRIFYNFFSVLTSILIVYCALQINGTVSL